MAIKLSERNARIISVHDEEEPVRFFIPNVIPGSYLVPGVNAPADQFDLCRFSFTTEKKSEELIRYAAPKMIHGVKYVDVTVFEAVTMIVGTGEQKFDEFNKLLFPDVQRVRVPLPAERVANEIERQFGFMGLMATDREAPTQEDLKMLDAKRIAWMRHNVQETSKWAKRSALNITAQSLRHAYFLYHRGLLNPLPEWAVINPEGKLAEDTFNCENCHAVIRKDIVSCLNCGAVYDWKRAVELGIKAPADVPPSKRAEAGLLVVEFEPESTESSAAQQAQKSRVGA